MSNFSALKTAIQAAIKQNGNNEITGDILQDILLSIVSTLGDSAINNLETGLQTESQTRGNDDAALSQAIENEATARGNQDTQLGNLITGIKNNIDNGYVYAGIATPSTTPVSGRVFYIATQAGTYTNLGNTAVKPGISILKYNGSAWSNEQVIYTDGGVFDVSAYNGGATYASLEALLSDANLLTIIPSAVRKGGMSIKFVSSVDNKYVQYRSLLFGSFTTGQFINPANWIESFPNVPHLLTCVKCYGNWNVTDDILAIEQGKTYYLHLSSDTGITEKTETASTWIQMLVRNSDENQIVYTLLQTETFKEVNLSFTARITGTLRLTIVRYGSSEALNVEVYSKANLFRRNDDEVVLSDGIQEFSDVQKTKINNNIGSLLESTYCNSVLSNNIVLPFTLSNRTITNNGIIAFSDVPVLRKGKTYVLSFNVESFSNLESLVFYTSTSSGGGTILDEIVTITDFTKETKVAFTPSADNVYFKCRTFTSDGNSGSLTGTLQFVEAGSLGTETREIVDSITEPPFYLKDCVKGSLDSHGENASSNYRIRTLLFTCTKDAIIDAGQNNMSVYLYNADGTFNRIYYTNLRRVKLNKGESYRITFIKEDATQISDGDIEAIYNAINFSYFEDYGTYSLNEHIGYSLKTNSGIKYVLPYEVGIINANTGIVNPNVHQWINTIMFFLPKGITIKIPALSNGNDSNIRVSRYTDAGVYINYSSATNVYTSEEDEYVRISIYGGNYIYPDSIDQAYCDSLMEWETSFFEKVAISPWVVALNDEVKTRDILESMKRPTLDANDNYSVSPITLLHFSDIHGSEINLKRILEYHNYYQEYFNDILCTGDIVYNDETSDFNYWHNAGADEVLITIGNHECKNSQGSETKPQSEVYTRYFAPFVSNWIAKGAVFPTGYAENYLMYYYKDYPVSSPYSASKGLRMICLDSMHPTSAQTAWLAETLADAQENNLTVICANHFGIRYADQVPIDVTYNTLIHKGNSTEIAYEAVEEWLNIIQGFIEQGGIFACWLFGHWHADWTGHHKDYPEQLFITLGPATSRAIQTKGDDVVRIEDKKERCNDLFNVVTVDTDSSIVKIFRVGANIDRYLRPRNVVCYNFNTNELIVDY